MTSLQIDEPGPIRDGESLDTGKLQGFLRNELDAPDATLTVTQFPSGFSNLTYAIEFAGQEFVLRRPPFGNTVKSAHDMHREYRVLSKLCEAYSSAPRPILHCDDPDILGDEFYLMERRRGVILRGATVPPPLHDATLMQKLCEAFVDKLAELHTVDYRAAGLGELGRPEGFVERQVRGWSKRYENAKTHDFQDIENLAAWLAENMPEENGASLIHNDYKFDNILLNPNDLTEVVAVLDWEMATVGDPLMDLGTSLSYWIEAKDPPDPRLKPFGPTMLPGSLTRSEFVERYFEATDRNASDPLFYYAFGLFKLAGIVQQIYARFERGHTKDPRFADLHHMVQAIGERAATAIAAGRI